MNEIILQKLGLAKFNDKAIINCPEYLSTFEGIAHDTVLGSRPYDLIIHFVFTLDEFKNHLEDIIANNRLNPGGVVYFAYPKKGNKRYDRYIGRDDFFTVIDMDNDGYVGTSDIKFNKMVALDDTFTVIGLKHLSVRKRNTQPSQCVSAYTDRIPELVNALQATPDALTLFSRLTPGYQRGWARYVYAVKTPATQHKHFEEMIDILRKGYKSIDLYRQDK